MPVKPPELSSPDFEISEEAIKASARNEGYGVFKRLLKKDKRKGVVRRNYAISQKNRDAEAGERRSSNRRTDCLFKLTVARSTDDGLWHVKVEKASTITQHRVIRHSVHITDLYLMSPHLSLHLSLRLSLYPSLNPHLSPDWSLHLSLSMMTSSVFRIIRGKSWMIISWMLTWPYVLRLL